MALINSDVIPASATAYEIEQSLRFEADDSSYLSKTFSSGSTTLWTWSGWVKRTEEVYGDRIFACAPGSADSCIKWINGQFNFQYYNGSSTVVDLRTSPLYRDPSAWYHFVVIYDSANATSTDRVRIYVNGTRVTDFSTATYPSSSLSTNINSANTHYIGRAGQANSSHFSGYLAEVNFIDGQALDPSYFGETGLYGEWKPIEYTGTYGTNGFYLPFKNDYTVEGFSTVTYTGDGSTQYIGGVGFQPDLVWQKRRDGIDSHVLTDAIRGTDKSLYSDRTDAEASPDPVSISALNSDGFTLGANGKTNGNGETVVAWCWDMGGSNATNTDGSITSTVRANPTYGQSIVSWTGTGANATVGHGLSSAPEMVIVKNRGDTGNWQTYHHGIASDAETDYINLNSNGASVDSASRWNDTAPTSSVIHLGSDWEVNESGYNIIAYCFHSVSGYSKFGSYTGTGSAGTPSVSLGFRPAFVIVKRAIGGAGEWHMFDSVRNPDDNFSYLSAESSSAEVSWDKIDFTDTGFTIQGDSTNSSINKSGDTYIYMAFADTREFAYWLDQSGNNNDWTSNNLTESDISVDSPTNNFATWNVLHPNATRVAFSEGNLKATVNTNGTQEGTFGVSSGKWYYEFLVQNINAKSCNVGVAKDLTQSINYGSNGTVYRNGSLYETVSTYTTGDIIGVAFDIDSSTASFYKNNTLESSVTGITFDDENLASMYAQAVSYYVTNFGQDSSFAGNKTAQGNTDSNEIGDFYYTPPSGYLALCTANLPDPAVIPSENFNTVLYTGNDTSQSITGVGFQPDFTWLKHRNHPTAHQHNLFDVVRGATKTLHSNSTGAEETLAQMLTSFDSDGFSVGNDNAINDNNINYVSWNWKANGSGSSNTDGSITSTVSANQDAGFSIVSYTGNGSNSTVGHGLTQAPEMIITKNRDTGANWGVYNKDIGASNGMYLSLTNASESQPSWWNSTAPTSTVFSIGTDTQANRNGDNFIAYCFHSVDGFSKVGSYTGNGSSDGTFVYTGFRVAYVMYKRSNSTGGWRIADNPRSGYRNEVDQVLRAESSSAEGNYSGTDVDFLSNGFKLRGTDSIGNTSGGTYIYIAFAENPFKYTNAR